MKHHIEKARSSLGELGSLASKTETEERNILKAAESRLDEVQKMIKRMQPGIEIASKQEQDKYVELVEERGQLNLVVSRAKAVLRLET